MKNIVITVILYGLERKTMKKIVITVILYGLERKRNKQTVVTVICDGIITNNEETLENCKMTVFQKVIFSRGGGMVKHPYIYIYICSTAQAQACMYIFTSKFRHITCHIDKSEERLDMF